MFDTILERVQPLAFLPGLLLVLLLLVLALVRGRQARAWLFPAAIPLALLSVTLPAIVNAFAYVNAFQGIASTGAGGTEAIAVVITAACRALLYGVLGLLIGLVLIVMVRVIVTLVPYRAGAPPVISTGHATEIVLSLVGVALLLAAGVIVWFHFRATDMITIAAAPADQSRAMAASSIGAGVDAIAWNLQAICIVGPVLAVALFAAAVVSVAVLFRRTPGRAGVILSSALVAVTAIGCLLGMVGLSAQFRDIDRTVAAAADAARARAEAFAREYPPPPPPPPVPPGGRMVAPVDASRARADEPPVASVVGGVPGGVDGGVVGGIVGGVPGAPPPTAVPRRVGGTIKAPLQTKYVAPVYPPLARSARVQGAVVIEATIDPDGKVSDAKVLSGHPLLVQAALDAVRQWEYTPTLLNGAPIPIVLTVTVNFSLQ